MATTLSTKLTNAQAGALVRGSYRLVVDSDSEALGTGEVDASDVVIFALPVPTNAKQVRVEIQNDELDSHATPTLVLDVGIAASEAIKTYISGTLTAYARNDVIDADLLVDGVTTLQSATTNWTELTPDSATNGPEDQEKEVWELMGWDADPNSKVNLCLVMSAGAATAAAGDVALRVSYLVPN